MTPGTIPQADQLRRAQPTPLESPPETRTQSRPLPSAPRQPREASTPFTGTPQDTVEDGGRYRRPGALGGHVGSEGPPPVFQSTPDARAPQERHNSSAFWGGDRAPAGPSNAAAAEQIITPVQLYYGDEEDPSPSGEGGLSREPSEGSRGQAERGSEAPVEAQDRTKEGTGEEEGRRDYGVDQTARIVEEVVREVLKKRGRQLDFGNEAAAADEQMGGNGVGGGPGAKRRKQTGDAEGNRPLPVGERGVSEDATADFGAQRDDEEERGPFEREHRGEGMMAALDSMRGGTRGRGRGTARGGRGKSTTTRGRGRGAARGGRGRGRSTSGRGRGRGVDSERYEEPAEAEESGSSESDDERPLGARGRGTARGKRGRGSAAGGRGRGTPCKGGLAKARGSSTRGGTTRGRRGRGGRGRGKGSDEEEEGGRGSGSGTRGRGGRGRG